MKNTLKHALHILASLSYIGNVGLAAFLLLLSLNPGIAWASTGPASTSTVAADAYIIDVSLSQNPPYADQPFTVTVQPQKHTLKLHGKIVAQPGLGTNATPLTTPLTAASDNSGSLSAMVRVPVRGAWNITVHLDGPQGSGVASVAVDAGAPGAMPFWLAWTIGSIPLLFIAFWIWHQRRYRKKLELQSSPA